MTPVQMESAVRPCVECDSEGVVGVRLAGCNHSQPCYRPLDLRERGVPLEGDRREQERESGRFVA